MANGKRRLFVAACCLPVCVGCAAGLTVPWKLPDAEVPDVRPIRQRRAAEAAETFDRERNRAEYLAARSNWRQGDYAECRARLEKILLRDPQYRDALLLLADVQLETDHPAEAIETLAGACEAMPNDAEAAHRLGHALEAGGRSDEAAEHYRRASELAPQNSMFAEASARSETAAAPDGPTIAENRLAPAADAAEQDDPQFAAVLDAWESDRRDEAAELLKNLLTAEPEHRAANMLQAELELGDGRRASALERVERLAERYPDDWQVRQACGLVYEAAGDQRRAEQAFAAAQQLAESVAAEPAVVPASYETEIAPVGPATIESQPPLQSAVCERRDPRTAVSAAVAALKLEQSELALRVAEEGATAFPDSAELHRIAGLAAYRLGRCHRAEVLLARSAALDNTQGLTYFLLGSVCGRLGQTETAERHFRTAARLDPRYAVRK